MFETTSLLMNGVVRKFNCEYKDIPEEYKSFPCIETWDNFGTYCKYAFHNFKEWKITNQFNSNFTLEDNYKEIRHNICLTEVLNIVSKFTNWNEYDLFQTQSLIDLKDRQISDLNSQVNKLTGQLINYKNDYIKLYHDLERIYVLLLSKNKANKKTIKEIILNKIDLCEECAMPFSHCICEEFD